MKKDVKRCGWVGSDKLMIDYHNKEWGVPVHNDKKLFEFLTLEGAQAGLSWQTILKRRKNYNQAFDSFDTKKISLYNNKDIIRLMKWWRHVYLRGRILLHLDSNYALITAFRNISYQSRDVSCRGIQF